MAQHNDLQTFISISILSNVCHSPKGFSVYIFVMFHGRRMNCLIHITFWGYSFNLSWRYPINERYSCLTLLSSCSYHCNVQLITCPCGLKTPNHILPCPGIHAPVLHVCEMVFWSTEEPLQFNSNYGKGQIGRLPVAGLFRPIWSAQLKSHWFEGCPSKTGRVVLCA
jgi:hypothetical protein